MKGNCTNTTIHSLYEACRSVMMRTMIMIMMIWCEKLQLIVSITDGPWFG